MYKWIIALLLLCLAKSESDAQGLTIENSSRWDELKYDLGSIIGGMGYTYSRPFHWDGRQRRDFGFVMLGGLAATLIDEPVRDLFMDQHDDIPDFVLDYGRNYGGPSVNFALTGAVYFTGFLAKKPKLKRLGIKLVSSAATAGFLQQVTKYVFGRARPFTEEGPYHSEPFKSERDFHSFPSGHAMMGFTNAYILAKEFESPWVKAGFYALGAIPGLTRMWEDQHWFTDVGMGILISILSVESVEKYLAMRYDQDQSPTPNRVDWSINFMPNGIGLTCQF